MEGDIKYLTLLGELAEYINRDSPNIEALCQFCVMRTFSHLGASSIFVSQLGNDAMIRQIGSFGISDALQQSWSVRSLDDSLPVSKCIRTDKMLWISSAEDWYRDYPSLKNFEVDEETKTFIAWPIKIKRSQMSALGMTLRTQIAPTPEEITFLTTVGGLFALHLSSESENARHSTQSNEEKAYNFLSRRQREILDLMADGNTNIEIGAQLAYSESTIRQETMKIYEIFEATGRADVIRKFRTIQRRL